MNLIKVIALFGYLFFLQNQASAAPNSSGSSNFKLKSVDNIESNIEKTEQIKADTNENTASDSAKGNNNNFEISRASFLENQFGQIFPKCSNWSAWQESNCFWPNKRANYFNLPAACTFVPVRKNLPEAMTNFIRAKSSELYDMMANELESRGASSICGMCARKLRCRTRNNTNDPEYCAQKKSLYVRDSSCDVNKPCQLTLVDGGCPAPRFFNARVEILVSALEATDVERRKRETSSNDFSLDSNIRNSNSSILQSVPSAIPNDGEIGHTAIIADNVTNEIDKQLKNAFNSSISLTPPTWNCVKNKSGSKCLCCCEFFMPDPESETCVDISEDIAKYVGNQAENTFKRFDNFISGRLRNIQ